MFCPISIHGEFPDLPIWLWKKGNQCRLDIHIGNASDTLKWRWFLGFREIMFFLILACFFHTPFDDVISMTHRLLPQNREFQPQ